jgi:hypothetical protein
MITIENGRPGVASRHGLSDYVNSNNAGNVIPRSQNYKPKPGITGLPDGDAATPRRPRLPFLLRELIEAHRLIRRPDYDAGFRRCGIRTDDSLIIGLAAVETCEHYYTPAAGGKGALIVPYFQGNVLLDLVAVGLETFTCRTRLGIATVLGGEHIEAARERETSVRLFKDPITWLRNGRNGACIVDWRVAQFILADVPGVACDDELLAAKIERLRQPAVVVPRIFVREAANAA